jgi:hypothetical protein
MTRSCIIRCHPWGGLFSQINKVITCALAYEQFHVDWSTGGMYGFPEDGNVWNHLFSPTSAPDEECDVIVNYPHYRFTGRDAGYLYLRPEPWRAELHKVWKRLRVRPEIYSEAEAFAEQHFRGRYVVAALVRSTALDVEQLVGKCPTWEEYAWALRRQLQGREDGVVFLATCSADTVEWFAREFGDRLIVQPDVPRSATHDVELHTAAQQSVDSARRCLVDVLLLSMCDHFIHPVSNMATGVWYIHPPLPNTFIQ